MSLGVDSGRLMGFFLRLPAATPPRAVNMDVSMDFEAATDRMIPHITLADLSAELGMS